MSWSLLDMVISGLALASLVFLATSKLVRIMLLDIIQHPLRRTRIEIHGKKDITVKST